MSKVPKYIRVWKKNPDWTPPEPTLDNIKVDKYLTGNVVPIRKVARKHRRAYRDTLARLSLAAHRAGYGAGGKMGKVHVSSSYRSYAEQLALYQKFLAGLGFLANKPNTSKHEFGLAIDVPDVRMKRKLILECRKLGLNDDVPSEKWHLTNHGFAGE